MFFHDFDEDFLAFYRIRVVVENLAAIPEVAEVWAITDDAEFWETVNRIEIAGRTKDTACTAWLANLTQLDDAGPMGRNLWLSKLALAALATMPTEAFNEAVRLWNDLPSDAGNYRKMGICMIFEASGSPAAVPFLQRFLDDSKGVFKGEVQDIIDKLSVNG